MSTPVGMVVDVREGIVKTALDLFRDRVLAVLALRAGGEIVVTAAEISAISDQAVFESSTDIDGSLRIRLHEPPVPLPKSADRP